MDELPQCELHDTTLGSYVHSEYSDIAELFTHLGVQPHNTVVDIGCGDGRACFVATERFNARSVGIDCNDKLIEGMNEKVRAKGLDPNKCIGICGDGLLSCELLEPYQPVDVIYLYILAHRLYLLYPVLRQLFAKNPKLVVASAFTLLPTPKEEEGYTEDVLREGKALYPPVRLVPTSKLTFNIYTSPPPAGY
eukprot:PhF_6_TR10116/c0_g1_i1/m.15730